jgi:hypothetical protein
MANKPVKDIVVDTNVIKLYNNPGDPLIRALFFWIRDHGTLTISQKMLIEYGGIGNRDLAGLLNRLQLDQRLNPIKTQEFKNFASDLHYSYTCNSKDRWVAKLVFLSFRKKLVANDKRLVNDINRFKKVNGIKPQATKSPNAQFYI